MATIIVAGINTDRRASNIFLKTGTTFNVSFPSELTMISIALENRNDLTSTEAIFSNPTIIPITTSTISHADDVKKPAPKTTASITPIKNVHPPRICIF